jgi:hypothetical protein
MITNIEYPESNLTKDAANGPIYVYLKTGHILYMPSGLEQRAKSE